MKEKWCIIPDGGGLGDHICLISALRHFARCSLVEVGIDSHHQSLSTLVSLYNDDLITQWKRTWESACQPFTTPENLAFEDKEVKWKIINDVNEHVKDKTGVFGNYHGMYLASFFNLIPSNPPSPELPKIKGILKGKIGIQPQAGTLINPPDEFIQKIIDFCKDHTGEDVIALGKTNTPRNLKNVNYDFLKDDIGFLMSCINELGLLLTPISACSVLAAGYQTPTILWMPDNTNYDLNWIVNFCPWNVLKLRFEIQQDDDKIKEFIKTIFS